MFSTLLLSELVYVPNVCRFTRLPLAKGWRVNLLQLNGKVRSALVYTVSETPDWYCNHCRLGYLKSYTCQTGLLGVTASDPYSSLRPEMVTPRATWTRPDRPFSLEWTRLDHAP